MSESQPSPTEKGIPDQLIQIAHEQEGGAERVINQIEVVQNSFEEIQSITRECQAILMEQLPPSEARDLLINRMEEMAIHADNGMYNIQGVYDLFQYQDIVRQKLEKVGRRLIDVSQYILANLLPSEELTKRAASSGRDILQRKAQDADQVKDETDAIIADFFAKLRAKTPPTT